MISSLKRVYNKRGVIVLMMLIGFSACGPMYEHRLLDGHWQMQTITYTDGEKKEAEDIYYGFQLHLINLKNIKTGNYFGTFDYIGDSLHVHIMGARSQDAMHAFGMNDTLQRFKVEMLSRNKLVLQSSYSLLEFRKY